MYSLPTIQKKIESKFLEINCPRCYTKHIIFGKSSTLVKCRKCNKRLIKTTGGKVKIKAQVKKIL